jgi:hypothetical protein
VKTAQVRARTAAKGRAHQGGACTPGRGARTSSWEGAYTWEGDGHTRGGVHVAGEGARMLGGGMRTPGGGGRTRIRGVCTLEGDMHLTPKGHN